MFRNLFRKEKEKIRKKRKKEKGISLFKVVTELSFLRHLYIWRVFLFKKKYFCDYFSFFYLFNSAGESKNRRSLR